MMLYSNVKCSQCGGELNTGFVCVKCDTMHNESWVLDEIVRKSIETSNFLEKNMKRSVKIDLRSQIAALEQQLAECQRKAAALDWLEEHSRETPGWESILYFDDEQFTAEGEGAYPIGRGTTLVEAIESLREQEVTEK